MTAHNVTPAGGPEPALIADYVFSAEAEMFEFDRVETPADAVFQAIGAASVCWEHLEGTGIFDSTRAKAIGDALLAKLVEFGLQIDGPGCEP